VRWPRPRGRILAVRSGGHARACSLVPAREVILVLEGAATIEIDDGPTLELKVGDIASMPEGAVTTWHLTPGFKELWVIG